MTLSCMLDSPAAPVPRAQLVLWATAAVIAPTGFSASAGAEVSTQQGPSAERSVLDASISALVPS